MVKLSCYYCNSGPQLSLYPQIHRKKMNSRRLDYDYKINQHEKGKVTEDELYSAEDKFNESMQAADVGMKKFVQSQVHWPTGFIFWYLPVYYYSRRKCYIENVDLTELWQLFPNSMWLPCLENAQNFTVLQTFF